MKNAAKRTGALLLAALLTIGSALPLPVTAHAEEVNAADYENAEVLSKGSIADAAAVIKGESASIVKDEQTNSSVLKLSGGLEGSGYLSLPENLYEGVTDGFSVAMDIFILKEAVNYQRIFQSTPIKLGTGNTLAWDASDLSVDLCDFNSFRTSIYVGSGSTASGKVQFNWGSGAVKGEWKRLVITISESQTVMYYGGEQYAVRMNRNAVKRLFEDGMLENYRYNALGRSVYNTDSDICAMYDNVAFYAYALNEEQALAGKLPEDASYFWDFEEDSVIFAEKEENIDSMSTYTDGTELTKVFDVISPDGTLTTGIYTDAETGRYFYSTAAETEAVLHASLLGMVTESVNLSEGLLLAEDSVKHSADSEYNEVTFMLTKEKASITVMMRMYNDGLAYRYVIEEEGAEGGRILSEASEVIFPDKTVLWTGEPSDTYEGNYRKRTMESVKNSVLEMSRPLLASVHEDKYWVLMTEASVFNVEEPYCASIFGTEDGEKNIRYIFGRKQETSPEVSYPFTSPWRVAIITDNINDLAGSRLVGKLNPQADESVDWSFVKPGKAVWSWWSSSYDAIEPQTQKDYIDFAAQNGWEYCLVDYGWELWEDYKEEVQDIVAYGKEKGVGVFLWYGVDKFDNAHIFDLDNRETIEEQFAWCESIGVAGVKIDYINSDTQEAMKILYDLADVAAEHKLMIVYHGCTNPNGEEVTYPNIISYEAVRGQEYYKWGAGADVGTLLTFLYTRNVTGSMDFTPTAYRLSNLDTTAGFQLAQTVVYESAVQHFAHSAYVYEGSKVLSFLNQVPTVWDASVYGGYPGEYNWVARNSGADWYVGAMTADARELEIRLDFLEEGKTYTAYVYRDDAAGEDLEVEEIRVTANDSLTLSLLENGGAAAILTERVIETSTAYDKAFTYYEAEDAVLGGACTRDVNNYASGLASVGWIGNGGQNDITFNHVTAGRAGTYELRLFYITGEPRNLSVSVNGGEALVLENLIAYQNDWSAACRVSVKIELKEGVNTIRLFRETGYAPSIDRIAVSTAAEGEEPEPTAAPTAEPTKTPEPTAAPTKMPTQAETPDVTGTPQATLTPELSGAAELTGAPDDSEASGDASKKPLAPWLIGGAALLLAAAGAFIGIRRGKKK